MATRDFIRPRDINAFTAAAKVYKVYILVRRTNPASLKYIGMPGFTPKPLDCKPKTADADIVIDGRRRETAGLVVDPTLVGAGAIRVGQHDASCSALLDVQVYDHSQLGAPMVRHGDQEKYGDHSDEDVDVFFPDGRVQELRGLAAIETFYRTEFKGRRPAGQGRATVP